MHVSTVVICKLVSFYLLFWINYHHKCLLSSLILKMATIHQLAMFYQFGVHPAISKQVFSCLWHLQNRAVHITKSYRHACMIMSPFITGCQLLLNNTSTYIYRHTICQRNIQQDTFTSIILYCQLYPLASYCLQAKPFPRDYSYQSMQQFTE